MTPSRQDDPREQALAERERRDSVGGQFAATDEAGGHADAIRRLGYSVMRDALDAATLARLRERLDATYERQAREFGAERLAALGDRGVCRAPLLYDPCFLELAAHPRVTAVARRLMGEWIILGLQNGILNQPGGPHSQRAWHRDLPYQNWTTSRPLAVGALFLVDDFTAENGATEILPGSHLFEDWPSADYVATHAATVIAPAGSVLLFNAMAIHRAGVNRSAAVRRAVNHNYTIPPLKQQYDFPRALGPRPDLPPRLAELLGYTSAVPADDRAWREERAARNQRGY